MKPLRQEEEAVSPVIGVILMVAITVVLAAVVYALVTGLGGGAEETPTVAMDEEDTGDWIVIRADKDLEWEDFTVSGCTTVPTGSMEAGDRLLGCSEFAVMTHDKSNAIVWRASA